jgi:hypothetical protein
MNKPSCFAEVIESNLDHFTAQCWQWDFFPSFGNLVCVQDSTKIVLGIVTNISTGSIDPTRTPLAYQKTEEELQLEQPQIFEFLRTTFTVQIVGYIEHAHAEKIIYLLPPTPCKIHAFVASCSPSIINQFFEHNDYLHLLFAFAQAIPNLDELLLAIIKHRMMMITDTSPFIDDFCQIFTLLTGNDYRRLKLFLKRVEALS